MSPRMLTIALIALGVTVGATAQELDFTLANRLDAETTDKTRLRNESRAGASLSWILSPDSDLLVSGGYTFEYDDTDPDESVAFHPVFDRGRFSVRRPLGTGNGRVFQITAGRFGFSDTTGLVVDTPADGLSASLLGPTATLRLQSGYTGLLFRDSTDLRLSASDIADADNPFGPAHLLARAELAFPEVLSRQSIIFDVTGHADMPELPTSEIDDTTDRILGLYAGLTVKGPISPRVFYTLYGLARTGRYFADDSADAATYSLLAGASGASIRAYTPRLGKSRAELQAMYASGDGGFVRFSPAESGTATFFAPITPTGLGQFAPVAFSNVFLTRFAYSVQPWDLGAGPREGLRTELSIAAVYRPSTGTGTFDGLSADTEAGYAGTEAGATVEYRPFSDLRMMVESVLFFPASLLVDGGVAANTDAQSLVSAMIELSF